jgi:hypothetical protein
MTPERIFCRNVMQKVILGSVEKQEDQLTGLV